MITLKAARVNKGLSRKQAASALSIAVDSLRNYEVGKASPRVDLVKKMEALYEIAYKDINFVPIDTNKKQYKSKKEV